jgi:CRISPR-associated protein Csd1
LILAINDKIDPSSNYPRVLALQEQAQFALGYYHQRQAFFTKAETTPEAEAAISSTTSAN